MPPQTPSLLLPAQDNTGRKPLHDDTNLTPLVLMLLLGHLLMWTVLANLSHRAPDVDNMEQFVWASALEWGYYKHPPLPSWILYGLVSVFGRPVWLSFFTGQLSVVLSLWFVWKLGCELTTQRRALIATLLVSMVSYFTVGGLMNNHNTMQLWSVAAAIWMFYRALRYDSLWDWAGFGFFCGLAFLTKYSALIQFATFFLFLLVAGHLRRARVWQGIALATLVFAFLVTPHLVWLTQMSGPFGYASHSLAPVESYGAYMGVLISFCLSNLGRLAPLGFALAFIRIGAARQEKSGLTVRHQTKMVADCAAADRFFLLFVGLGPVVLTLLVSALLKTPLVAHWAATFFLLFGFFAFWVLKSGNDAVILRMTITVVVILQILTAIGYNLARGPFSDMTGRATRSTFPGEAISRQVHAQWQEHVRTPLVLVVADTWLGGNIATRIGPKVQVLINGDFSKSPWVQPAEATRCGMLVAINRSPSDADVTDEKVVDLMNQAAWRGTIQLPWTKKTDGPQVIVDWGIIAPQPGCRAAEH
ncbi:MAG: glycosyltransferase family 39 protein [Glaciimonas sp.]|nr:glycosyltransferase family 39 protein [Glaciimonas sp.]